MMSVVACAVAFNLMANQRPPQNVPSFDADLFRKNEQVFSGHAEFLYWTIEEGALDYALKMKTPSWGPANNYAQGNFETATYNFDPGVRLAFSFFRAERYWEVKWQYTRMTLTGSNHTKAPTGSGEYLTGTWPQITTNPLTSAESSLHFNYNLCDMLIARVFIPNPHLRLRFFGGATGGWMSQQWIVHYLDDVDNLTRLNNKWTYAAGGLRFGTTVDWFWSGHMYVTATGSTAVVVGSYHNHSKQTSSFSPSAGYDTSVPLRNAMLENIRPSFSAQVAIGPSWQKNFKKARAEVFAGYELTIWTNLQELYHSTAGAPSATKETWINTSTLALHGISVRLTGDF